VISPLCLNPTGPALINLFGQRSPPGSMLPLAPALSNLFDQVRVSPPSALFPLTSPVAVNPFSLLPLPPLFVLFQKGVRPRSPEPDPVPGRSVAPDSALSAAQVKKAKVAPKNTKRSTGHAAAPVPADSASPLKSRSRKPTNSSQESGEPS